MQKITHYTLILIATLLAWHTQAQIKLDTENYQRGQGVREEHLPYLLKGMETALGKYAESADLFDPVKKQISREKVDIFVALFDGEATLSPDHMVLLSKDTSVKVSFLTYYGEIFSKMGKYGVPFVMTNPRLEKINYDAAKGVYVSEVLIDKKLKYGLRADDSVMEYPNGRKTTQRIIFQAEQRTPGSTLIVRIMAILVENVEDKSAIVVVGPTGPKEKKTDKKASKSKEPASDVAVVTEDKDTKKPEKAKKEKKAKKRDEPVVTVTPPVVPSPVVPTPVPTKPGDPVLDLSKAEIDSQIKPEVRDKIIASMQQAVADYVNLGDMYNPTTREVTIGEIEKFERLFDLNAKVYNDLLELEQGRLEHYKDYNSIVYDDLRKTGVKFTIERFEVVSIRQLDDDYFTIVVRANKHMLMRLSEQDRRIIDKPADLKLRFKYGFQIDGQPLISEVSYDDIICVNRERKETFISFQGSAGGAIVQSTLGSNWTFGNSGMDISGKMAFGGGISFSSNKWYKEKSCKKPLFWHIGVSYIKTQLDAKVNNWIFQFIPDPNASYYIREVNIQEATQQHTLHIAEGNLGLRYRVATGFFNSWFIDAAVVPSYLIKGASNFNRNDQIVYDGIFMNGNESIRLSTPQGGGRPAYTVDNSSSTDINSFGIGTYELKKDFDRALDGNLTIGLAGRLGISYYRRIGVQSGFFCGADLTWMFKSPIPLSPLPSNPYLGPATLTDVPDTAPASLLQGYFSNVNQHNINLRAGLVFKFKQR